MSPTTTLSSATASITSSAAPSCSPSSSTFPPAADLSTAEGLIETVQGAHNVLHSQNDLSPRNPIINETLTRLVGSLCKDYPPDVVQAVLADPGVCGNMPSMLDNLARAEGAMEAFWADKLSELDTITQTDLESFWYWKSYTDLVARELPHLRRSGVATIDTPDATKTESNSRHSICFVGSGPLPLTAVVLLQLYPACRVTCVDISPSACRQSETLLRKAGLDAERINVVCADGASYDYADHDAVLVAALVPETAKVLRRIGTTTRKPKPIIAIRSAERLHTILYKPLNEQLGELPQEGPVARTTWAGDIINTTLFYEGGEAWQQRMQASQTGLSGQVGSKKQWRIRRVWRNSCSIM